MTHDFHLNLQAKLANYRDWARDRTLSHCRLVHYEGVDLIGSKTVPLHDVESEIEGLICEGFQVDWAEHRGRLYLRVWGTGDPKPTWQKVIEEQPLEIVDDLLREIEKQD